MAGENRLESDWGVVSSRDCVVRHAVRFRGLSSELELLVDGWDSCDLSPAVGSMDRHLDHIAVSSTQLRFGAIPAWQGAVARGGKFAWSFHLPA